MAFVTSVIGLRERRSGNQTEVREGQAVLLAHVAWLCRRGGNLGNWSRKGTGALQRYMRRERCAHAFGDALNGRELKEVCWLARSLSVEEYTVPVRRRLWWQLDGEEEMNPFCYHLAVLWLLQIRLQIKSST